MRFVASALILSGCLVGTMPEGSSFPNAADHAEIDRVIDAWTEHGHPYTDRCEEERYRIRLVIADENRFRSMCLRCGPGVCSPRTPTGCGYGCASACFVSDDYGTIHFGNYETPHIVIHEAVVADSEDWRATIRHEATHWLESCSGDRAVPVHSGPFWNDVLPTL